MDLALSILLSAVYLLTIPWHPFPGSWVIKAASVAILSVRAARSRAPGLAVALAFSAAGDALLEYSPGLFAAGLFAFLGAHVTYTITFVRSWQSPRVKVGAAAVVVYCAILAAWLLPATGALAVPVTIYVVALAAMVTSAITADLPDSRLAAGALLFLISDSILAIHRFRMAIPLEGWLVWTTYYLGQALIATGYLCARKTGRKSVAAGR